MSNPILPPNISAANKTAIKAAFNNLSNYLQTILPVYRSVPEASKITMRQHNNILDKFLTMLESCEVYL